MLTSAAKALSDATKHISMVTAPNLESVKLKRIQIVKITEAKALLIFVTDNGLVQDKMINVPLAMDVHQLEALSNMLTEQVQNTSLKEAEEIIKSSCMDSLKEQKMIMSEVLDAINLNREKKELVFGGAQNIFNYPEYKDVLYKVMSAATDLEFSIRIGKENPYDDFKDMSIVTATYKIGGEKIGSFGVIGPTRMDYARVLSVLNYVGMSLSDILSCLLQTENKK